MVFRPRYKGPIGKRMGNTITTVLDSRKKLKAASDKDTELEGCFCEAALAAQDEYHRNIKDNLRVESNAARIFRMEPEQNPDLKKFVGKKHVYIGNKGHIIRTRTRLGFVYWLTNPKL